MEARDPQAFSELSARSPKVAAQQLARAIEGLPANDPSPLDGIAAELCGRLRRSGDAPAAGKLASALAPRSPRFKLEHALAAFAQGDDAEAERAASADPSVLAVMAPLLDAARAATANTTAGAGASGATAATVVDGAPEVPVTEPAEPASDISVARPRAAAAGKRATPARKPRQPPDTRPPALRALHAVATAAAAASRGQIPAALQALRKMPPGFDEAVLAEEMSDALDLLGGKKTEIGIDRAAGRLSTAPAAQDDRVARAMVRALAQQKTARALEVGARLRLSKDLLRSLGVQGSTRSAVPGGASPVQAALALAAEVGADGFAEEHRAAACLYEGFGCLQTDAKRAARAFDRAIQLGADMLEGLRGKLLLAMSGSSATSGPGDVCPDCGGKHGGSAHEAAPSDVATAADRFARAARHVPQAAPFAAAASIVAAEAWDADENMKAALASIEAARAASQGSAAMREELDLIEAHAVAPERPARAAALIDGVLARDPAHLGAWRVKIELADEAGDSRRTGDMILAAAESTRDPELLRMARSLRLKRGEVAPFDGFVPGAVTAGALASDALMFLLADGPMRELPPSALACRAALGPSAQAAFDVALVAGLTTAEKAAEARRRLAAAVESWWGSPPILAKVAAITWLLELQGEMLPAARRLASRPDAGPALGALCDAAIAADDSEVANGFLRLGAMSWSRTEVQERRRAMERLPGERTLRRRLDLGLGRGPGPETKRGGAPDPAEARREIDAALAPEIQPGLLWSDGLGGLGNLDNLDNLDDPDDFDDPDDPDRFDAGDLMDLFNARRGGSLLPDALSLLGLTPPLLEQLTKAQMAKIVALATRFARPPFTPSRLAEFQAEVRKIVQHR